MTRGKRTDRAILQATKRDIPLQHVKPVRNELDVSIDLGIDVGNGGDIKVSSSIIGVEHNVEMRGCELGVVHTC